MTKGLPAYTHPATTTAGDGYPRRAFTADEVFRMQECGIINDDDSFELIDGDLVMMQSKNASHERAGSTCFSRSNWPTRRCAVT